MSLPEKVSFARKSTSGALEGKFAFLLQFMFEQLKIPSMFLQEMLQSSDRISLKFYILRFISCAKKNSVSLKRRKEMSKIIDNITISPVG